MRRMILRTVRHVLHYRVGYAVGVFLATAAVTCGVLHGKSHALPVQPLLLAVIAAFLEETVFSSGMLLASVRPFGGVLSGVILLTKAYRTGIATGTWLHAADLGLIRLIPLCLLGMILWITLLSGCCVAAYAALGKGNMNRREIFRWILKVWLIQVICIILRCLICAGTT